MTSSTTTTARAMKPISFQSPTSVKSIVFVSVFGRCHCGLNSNMAEVAERDGVLLAMQRAVAPGLDRRDARRRRAADRRPS